MEVRCEKVFIGMWNVYRYEEVFIAIRKCL